jgi:hypothetical protein
VSPPRRRHDAGYPTPISWGANRILYSAAIIVILSGTVALVGREAFVKPGSGVNGLIGIESAP